MPSLAKVSELIEDFKKGRMVILVDDESRENEGDLVLASDFVTSEAINFMIKEARGLVCLCLTAQHSTQLGLRPMVDPEKNGTHHKTAFLTSIEARSGVSTGISPADRARTIQVASHPRATSSDIVSPGHVFPLKAAQGGVLKRAGHTEAGVDLAKLSGLSPSAVICEIINKDGTMARLPELQTFSEKFNLKIGTIEDLIRYRLETQSFVKVIQETSYSFGGHQLRLYIFQSELDGAQHLAFVKGDISPDRDAAVRVHRENVLSDASGDKDFSLQHSLGQICKHDCGVFVYLRFPQRDLVHQVLESLGKTQRDKADPRNYGVGAQILRSLNIKKMKLLNGKSIKRVGLSAYGLEIINERECL